MGLQLLFASGKRPSRLAIKEFAEARCTVSISHDPLDTSPHLVANEGERVGTAPVAEPDIDERQWLELLRDGLTFDLMGLAPGEACERADIQHSFDFGQSPGALRLEALRLVPGKHLSGGGNSIPVVRTMLAIACDMVQHFDDLEAVVWKPIASVMSRRYFESIVSAWLEGGPFPAMGLTTIHETGDGALQSVGLEFWIGQELRIEPHLLGDKAEAAQLASRLINRLVIDGPLDRSERVTAPDLSKLVLQPSQNGRFIRVFRE
ncbi:hypothetical protein ACI5KX_09770 [Erythrobacter sp. GH1-10]|uniref:hypothetical protein n=1 Tax=Erythrobacter sp. GH1-10 TaxID=3349334 RepID=UPI003877B80E